MLKFLLFLITIALPLLILIGYVIWEHRSKRGKAPDPRPGELRLYYQYREFLNDRIGFFSFTFALAALGTDSPQFYALLSLGFVLIIWAIRAYEFRRIVKLWREEKSHRLSVWSILSQFPIFICGYIALLAVLFGWLKKPTLNVETAGAVAWLLSWIA